MKILIMIEKLIIVEILKMVKILIMVEIDRDNDNDNLEFKGNIVSLFQCYM
jgi:hypothetical protein